MRTVLWGRQDSLGPGDLGVQARQGGAARSVPAIWQRPAQRRGYVEFLQQRRLHWHTPAYSYSYAVA